MLQVGMGSQPDTGSFQIENVGSQSIELKTSCAAVSKTSKDEASTPEPTAATCNRKLLYRNWTAWRPYEAQSEWQSFSGRQAL